MARPSLLSREQIDSELDDLPEWHSEGLSDEVAGQPVADTEDGAALVREFKFKNFTVAFGFMASVATVAERMGHHPDWSNSYNLVTVRLSTHDAGGITSLDVELAHEMSALAGAVEAH